MADINESSSGSEQMPGNAAFSGEVGARSSRRRIGRRWFMLLMIFMVYTLAVADRSAISITAPLVSGQYRLSNFQIGLVFSLFGWAYGAFAVPAGMLIDRIGVKSAMLIGVIGWTLGTVLYGLSGSSADVFVVLLIGSCLIGAAQSVVTPGSARVLASWFPDRERGLANAFWGSSVYVAIGVSSPVMGWLCEKYHWQSVPWLMGVLGIGAAAIWAFGYWHPSQDSRLPQEERDYLARSGALIGNEGRSKEGARHMRWQERLREMRSIVRNRQLIAILVGQYCFDSIAFFVQSWVPTYLVKGHGISILNVGFMMTITGVAGAIGAVSGGFAVDSIFRKTGSMALSRKIPLTIGFSLTAAMILMILAHSYVALVVLLSLVFVGKSWSNMGWLLIADVAPSGVLASVGGLLNVVGAIGVAVTGTGVGYLVDKTHSFNIALVYVGCHGFIAITSYWLVLRKMERVAVAA